MPFYIFFDHQPYLITVDHYSDFYELDPLTNTQSSTIIDLTKSHFTRYGIPLHCLTDNDPSSSQTNMREIKGFHVLGSKGCAVVGTHTSHQCGLGSNPGVAAIFGLSLLLVLSFALKGFSPGTPVFPSPQKAIFPNSNSTRITGRQRTTL